uniref:Uncharacterized protein n=1 Tax=Anguilla anguilla TaxID=7936 RepID=A0A0E9R5E3_ANGAN
MTPPHTKNKDTGFQHRPTPPQQTTRVIWHLRSYCSVKSSFSTKKTHVIRM